MIEDLFLRLPQVLQLIGIKKTKLWQMIRDNQFPKQKNLDKKHLFGAETEFKIGSIM